MSADRLYIPTRLRSSIIITIGITLICCLFVRGVQAQEKPERKVLVKYSLFSEYFDTENYKSASPYLNWLLENAPTYRGESNWEEAVTMYEELAKQAEDSATKKAYLDSALAVIDRVVPTFKKHDALDQINRQDWVLERGRFLQRHSDVYADRQDEVLQAYEKAYEMAPEETSPYYVRYIVNQYVAQEQKQKALDFMKRAEKHFSGNQELTAYFNKMRNELFTSPKERIAFLEKRLEEEPENTELLRELFELYRDTGNTARIARIEEIGNRLLEAAPTAETHQILGDMKYQQAAYEEAMNHYQKALEIAEDSTMRRDLNFSMAEVQADQGNLQQARTYARAALDIDPDYGEAYMLIGDLYATAVQNAGSMDRMDRAVYWLVIDYYQRAKSVDPSVANQANQTISTYRKYVPTKEQMFFKGWKTGQSIEIDYGLYSWIDETTEVGQPKASASS